MVSNCLGAVDDVTAVLPLDEADYDGGSDAGTCEAVEGEVGGVVEAEGGGEAVAGILAPGPSALGGSGPEIS